MERLKLIQRVRALTRDFSNSIFREQDIIDFINEGIERVRQIIPELSGLEPLLANTQKPDLIPSQYRHLLSVYSASRCFSQDERHYQATTLMNEFETKLEELKGQIESGQIIITDPKTGLAVDVNNNIDYVDTTAYFGKRYVDLDYGVEGVR